MAVQKSRKTPSKRGMRRSHNALKNPALSEDQETGETHLRHHITADGYYRGKQVIKSTVEDIKEVETVEAELPCFIIPDPEFEAEYPKASHRLRLQKLTEETQERAISYEEKLTMWDHKELNLDPDHIGLDGSPTIVGRVDPIPKAPAEREATIINFKNKKEMEDVLGVMAPFAGED